MRYARLNPANVRAMALMGAMIPPGMPIPSYEAMGPEFGELFRSLRTEGIGEEMVLEKNFFIEQLLPKMVARGLTDAEMEHYRAPYPTSESRLPTLQWPRELPIGGEPKEAHDAVVANGEWLAASTIPKLLFYTTRGGLNPPPVVDWVVANVPNVETRFLGLGAHLTQEDHPHQIGMGITDWLRRTQNQ